MRNIALNGFSLIELMVVVAIAAILAAVGIPSYNSSVTKTRRAECRAALTTVMQAQERYYSQNSSYIAFSASSTDANEKKFKWWSGENAASSSCEIKATATCKNPDDTNLQNCVLLTAIPGYISAKVSAGHNDTACQSLTYDSRGQKGVTGSPAPESTAADCWK